MPREFAPNSASRVLVAGDVILDRYIHGHTTRISPEAPVPVVRVGATEQRPGGAANVAVNLRSLGVNVRLAGVTGDDADARALEQQLAEAGVECRFVRLADFPTVTKVRVISQQQQLLRLDYESGPSRSAADGLFGYYRELLPETDCVILSDYAKGGLARVDECIAAARRQGVPVLVDPKAKDYACYRGASLLTPNAHEFQAVVGDCTGDADIAGRGLELCRRLELGALLVTRGERGMTLVDGARGSVTHVAARSHEVFDVTGAGDTVVALMGAALVSGYTLETAMEFANAAAGLVVERLGTAAVSAAELNRALGGAAAGHGVLEPAQLAPVVQQARHRGERIVMTNGCFDLLHAGHVAYLEQARTLGDRLLVAVNDDASVARLKGDGRPVHPVAARMRVLAALAAVDWVTAFPEDTPEALVRSVRPDVLVKGGDYRPEQVAGAEFVSAGGGRVVILPLLEGHSTTATIDHVRNPRR